MKDPGADVALIHINRCLQASINRFLNETNQMPRPFTWTADPNKIIAAVKRGHQVLDLIHTGVLSRFYFWFYSLSGREKRTQSGRQIRRSSQHS
jgi:hypothetical protein